MNTTAITTSMNNTATVVGFNQYKVETQNRTIFIQKAQDTGLYSARAYSKEGQEGPVAMAKTLDEAIVRANKALNWATYAAINPVKAPEGASFISRQMVGDVWLIYIYEAIPESKHKYAAHLYKRGCTAAYDILFADTEQEAYILAYESLEAILVKD